jgi:uncharacterized protein involved in cysteine biosynthesis
MTGVGALFRGWGFLIHTPRSWPYAWVPAALLSVLLALLTWATIELVFPYVASRMPQSSSRWGETAWLGASGLLTLGLFVAGVFVALTLTPPLAGPALERIIGLRERALGVTPRPALGFWPEIWCGFRAQIFVLIWLVPVLTALWLCELLVPPAAVVTVPLKLVVTSLAVAWNLLDYPLTLRAVRMRERFLLFKRYKAACLGFGAAFSLLFWIPCGCQIVLLPVGAAAATDLVWQLIESDPELLPQLGRGSPLVVRASSG